MPCSGLIDMNFVLFIMNTCTICRIVSDAVPAPFKQVAQLTIININETLYSYDPYTGNVTKTTADMVPLIWDYNLPTSFMR